ncbi:MAG: hypothetical protein J1F63_07795 [Oscillospiraceae bacterium]|nr:hypothetical protein [Oscillospiraceae bacterium]
MEEAIYNITAVANNKEKGLSYRANFKRYNKAKASEFYLECLWILYAVLEDRTSAFLYYLGFTGEENRGSVTGSKKIKSQIRQICNIDENNARYKFDTMSGKLERIGQVIAWSSEATEEVTDYQRSIKNAVEKLVADKEFMYYFEYLNNEWRNKRNQLTHALFNKNPNIVVSELLPLVDDGYKAARVLDGAVTKLKKEKIRNRYKIK